MKKCTNCNREFDNDTEFCPSCGLRLTTYNADPMPAAPPAPAAQPYQAPFVQSQPNAEPVTVGEWMIMLVNLIPCIGPLIYFIIMLVWAFGNDAKPSKKTFGKANLIILLVSFGIVVLSIVVITIIGVSISSLIQDYEYIY